MQRLKLPINRINSTDFLQQGAAMPPPCFFVHRIKKSGRFCSAPIADGRSTNSAQPENFALFVHADVLGGGNFA